MNNAEPSTEPQLVTLEPLTVAVTRERVAMDALPAFFERAYHAVAGVAAQQGLTITGPPVGIYVGMPTDSVDVAAGFPTDRPVRPADGVALETLPAGPAVQVLHVGSYDTMVETYQQLMAWLAERGLAPGQTMWETYLTEPAPDGETAATRTLITWPVED